MTTGLLLARSAGRQAAQQGRGLVQLSGQAIQDVRRVLSSAGGDRQAGQVVQDTPDGPAAWLSESVMIVIYSSHGESRQPAPETGLADRSVVVFAARCRLHQVLD
jgi:hypothetical protein